MRHILDVFLPVAVPLPTRSLNILFMFRMAHVRTALGCSFLWYLLFRQVRATSPPFPIYSNCSTLSLYGPLKVPDANDITAIVTENGWFEASVTAVVLTNRSAIMDSSMTPKTEQSKSHW